MIIWPLVHAKNCGEYKTLFFSKNNNNSKALNLSPALLHFLNNHFLRSTSEGLLLLALPLLTVFENHSKSLIIQHCEQSELCIFTEFLNFRAKNQNHNFGHFGHKTYVKLQMRHFWRFSHGVPSLCRTQKWGKIR